MEYPRQEDGSGLPFPSSGDLPDPGIKLVSPALVGRLFTTEPPGKSLTLSLLIYLLFALEIAPKWIHGNVSGKIKMWLSSNSKLKIFIYSLFDVWHLNTIKM